MKTLNFFLISIGFVLFGANNLPGQTFWELNGNPVAPGQFLGSTNNQFLDFHQNNTRRVRHTNVNWPGYNNAVAVPNSSRIHFSLDGNNQLPFSMMHLGSALSTTLSRPWMHVGTTYGAGGDIMHVGIMQSPDPSGSQQGGDAVIAWGDNDDGFSPQQGPDNLRFLFISPSNINNPGANSAQGRETMRITPMGNVGIGDFSTMPLGIGGTYGQPRARLDVQFFSAIPQNTENTALNVLNNAIDPTGPFSTEKIGIRSESIATGIVGFAIGGRFRAERGVKTAGVWAEALGSGGGTSYGVYGSTLKMMAKYSTMEFMVKLGLLRKMLEYTV